MGSKGGDDPTKDFLEWERDVLRESCPGILEDLQAGIPNLSVEGVADGDRIYPGSASKDIELVTNQQFSRIGASMAGDHQAASIHQEDIAGPQDESDGGYKVPALVVCGLGLLLKVIYFNHVSRSVDFRYDIS